VIAGLGAAGQGVFTSQVAPYRIVPPAHWTPAVEQDPNSGMMFDTFRASAARVMLVVAFPAGTDPGLAVTAWQQSGHHVTTLGRVRVVGKPEVIYSYRDIAGDPPPVQQYAIVFVRAVPATFMILVASPPASFKADLPRFLAAVRTFTLLTARG
jgi:hypothetical protein